MVMVLDIYKTHPDTKKIGHIVHGKRVVKLANRSRLAGEIREKKKKKDSRFYLLVKYRETGIR